MVFELFQKFNKFPELSRTTYVVGITNFNIVRLELKIFIKEKDSYF